MAVSMASLTASPIVAGGLAQLSTPAQAGRVSVPAFTGLKAKSLSISNASRKQVAKHRRVVVEATAATGEVGSVTDGTFKSLVIDSDVPVLVDFWAPWCGPCRMIEPLINEIAQQYGGKLKVFKLNTDESPGVATEYGIRSIPTVMIFKRGKKVDTVIGAVPKSTLTSTIDKYL